MNFRLKKFKLSNKLLSLIKIFFYINYFSQLKFCFTLMNFMDCSAYLAGWGCNTDLPYLIAVFTIWTLLHQRNKHLQQGEVYFLACHLLVFVV